MREGKKDKKFCLILEIVINRVIFVKNMPFALCASKLIPVAS